jgi:hypothetical protein
VVKRLDLLREFEPPASTTPTRPTGSFNNGIRGRCPHLRLIQGGRQ